MYAIVEIAGKQYRVEKDKRVKVPLQHAENGDQVEFEKVLIYNDEKGEVQIGKPTVKDIKVSATVVEHGREKKVIVFKKKRRKGYQKKNGHRQDFSMIKIDSIGKVKAAKAKTAKAKADEKEEVKEA